MYIHVYTYIYIYVSICMLRALAPIPPYIKGSPPSFVDRGRPPQGCGVECIEPSASMIAKFAPVVRLLCGTH